MGKNPDPPGSGMNIPDLILRSKFQVFGQKLLKFFDADPDPGCKKSVSRILDRHPGSATLIVTLNQLPYTKN
jgi:hypothetical protein